MRLQDTEASEMELAEGVEARFQFDMKNDPGERENLIDATEAQPDLADLQRQLEGFFEKYADPEYDLWKGGRSKAGLLIKE